MFHYYLDPETSESHIFATHKNMGNKYLEIKNTFTSIWSVKKLSHINYNHENTLSQLFGE